MEGQGGDHLSRCVNSHDGELLTRMKTDRIWTDITDIVFVFIFMSRFGFEYGSIKNAG
jgi:hypothetical protein